MSEIQGGHCCDLMNSGDRLTVLRMAGASYRDGAAPKISLVEERKMKKWWGTECWWKILFGFMGSLLLFGPPGHGSGFRRYLCLRCQHLGRISKISPLRLCGANRRYLGFPSETMCPPNNLCIHWNNYSQMNCMSTWARPVILPIIVFLLCAYLLFVQNTLVRRLNNAQSYHLENSKCTISFSGFSIIE